MTAPFHHRPDDYSDEFTRTTLDPQRWTTSGNRTITISAGRATVKMIAGTDAAHAKNLVTVPRAWSYTLP